MNNLNTRQWSTPVIIGAGVFVSVSGVMMFLGVHNPTRKVTAIKLSCGVQSAALLLPVLTKLRFVLRCEFVLNLMALTQEGGNVMMSMIRSFEGSPLTEVAPLLDQSTENLVTKFETAGFIVEGTEKSIEEIAAANDTKPRKLVQVLFN